MELGSPFQRGRGGPGGWWIVDGPELHLDAEILVPDLAGWRRGRMPALPDVAYIELAPDWVCELLSPSTEARDRTDKLDIYGAAGVPWVWLVNPRLRTLEVLERSEGKWVLNASHHGSGPVRAPPFGAVELVLGDLWLASEPSTPAEKDVT
ncbi:hypothetical protein ENSA5_18010 [Enhygromyxa salina]|uniref:Putative restriction endonuclease domain-containing protein n=2 Tax=Enhygromyxa salina TaxID=215803 RepID=A0A2S9YDG5_9BACT|nr:hypothetical protein ENSA5_18010 [Enhygromyxa salina]